MTDETDNTAEIFPYLLLGAWPKAWQKYRGWVSSEGALPGLLLAAQASILVWNNYEVTGGQYWTSALRADLNLAFWRAEAAGWIKRVPADSFVVWLTDSSVHSTEQVYAQRLYELLTPVDWLFGASFHERAVRQKIRENRDSPDWQWWIVTLEGNEAIFKLRVKIEDAQKEQQRRERGIGLRPQT